MSSGVSFIPIGLAICYCYMSLRESHKIDIIKPWYELNFVESIAIVYCVLLGSIRVNWVFFISILKIGISALLVILGWYLLYNLEEFKKMVILIIRQNSLSVEENNRETDLENALTENFKDEKENKETEKENEISENEVFEININNEVEESFSDIDKNLEILVPQIDKIMENISVDTKKFIKYVELGDNDIKKTSKSERPLSSEELVTELERITDNLVRDTKKIADNVSLVSSMIVENSIIESSKIYENENSVLIVTPTISKTSLKAHTVTPRESKASLKAGNIEMDSKKLIHDTTPDILFHQFPKNVNYSIEHKESEIEEAVRLISNTENVTESMINAIENFVETFNQ